MNFMFRGCNNTKISTTSKHEIHNKGNEALLTKFCKFILGVRTKSSNMGVRGDLGSFPILFDVLYNMVKYWCHIANLKIDLNFLYVLNIFLEFGLTLLSSFKLSVQFCLNSSFKQYLTLHII
jgi:hypothetical protein